MDFKHVHLRKITLLSCDRCNLLHPHSLIPHPQSSIEKRRVLTQFFYWTSPPPFLNPPAVPRAGYYPGHIPFFQFRNTPVLMYGKLQKQNENNWYSINPCFTPSLEQIIPTNIPQLVKSQSTTVPLPPPHFSDTKNKKIPTIYFSSLHLLYPIERKTLILLQITCTTIRFYLLVFTGSSSADINYKGKKYTHNYKKLYKPV